jgi:hypothetical protein
VGISNVVLLQHEELIAIERRRLAEKAAEHEFKGCGLPAREDRRDVHLQPALPQHLLNPIYDVR